MTIGLPHVPISLHSCQLPYSPSIPPLSAPLPRSIPSFFPHESAHLPQEDENFFPPCKLLAYGKMNATLAGGLRNILREDLVCI